APAGRLRPPQPAGGAARRPSGGHGRPAPGLRGDAARAGGPAERLPARGPPAGRGRPAGRRLGPDPERPARGAGAPAPAARPCRRAGPGRRSSASSSWPRPCGTGWGGWPEARVNPFDLPGPQFLLFYAALAVATVVLLRLCRQRDEAASAGPTRALDQLKEGL